jgi:hypothetical protein
MYGEYGIPLEMDPDHPDTLYWGVDSDSLLRSVDRGKTWNKWGVSTFRSPCDLVVVPESDSSVIMVSDGITGSGSGYYFRSPAARHLHQPVHGRSSEIPGLACSRLRNNVTIGTNWFSGGVQRSANYGLTWPNVHNVGPVVGRRHREGRPDVVVFGTYSGTSGFVSTTGGGANSYIPDRRPARRQLRLLARATVRTIIAQQSAGIWKLASTQTMPVTAQTVAVTSPNGGEIWQPGSVHDITWNAANVAMARIQYRRALGDPWEVVAEVEGYRGRFPWTVPFDATAEARVEVSDAWDAAPADSSDQAFTISLPLIAEEPASVGYGSHAIGTEVTQVLTVTNAGTTLLVVSAITTGTSAFHAGRSSMYVPVGQSDTLGVTFRPVRPGTTPTR